MDEQKQIFERLVFGPFPANLAKILYGRRVCPGDQIYVTAGYKVQEPNLTRPDDSRRKFEHDAIMILVQCGERPGKGKTRKKIVNKDIASIEIKTTEGDIYKSEVDQYLGATRLFFYAAPYGLLLPLFDRLMIHPRKEVIGVIDSDAGQVVVLPQFQVYQKDRRDRLLARCYTSEHRFPFCSGDADPYAVHRVAESFFEKPDFVNLCGLRVNSDYLDTLR